MTTPSTPSYPSCSCPSCVDRCKHISGVMSPREAILAIQAGKAPQLMLVAFWEQTGDTTIQPVWHLQPTTITQGTFPAPLRIDSAHAGGRCTFLSRSGLCAIHDTPYKPIECRHAYGKDCPSAVGLPPCPEYRGSKGLWGTNDAQLAISLWRAALK